MINEYEFISKSIEYKNYIDNHRKLVQRAWDIIDQASQKYKLNSWAQNSACYVNHYISDIIKAHDMSKYLPEEFVAYRKKFYPVIGEEFSEEEFERAWEHHQKHNMHHWQSMEAVNYKHEFIVEHTIEMVCDWYAMSMQFGEGHRDYYNKNKDIMRLQDWQRDIIEDIYKALDLWIENRDELK